LASYYCPAGASTYTPCTPGSFCPASASVPTACPIARYSNATGLSATGNCQTCLGMEQRECVFFAFVAHLIMFHVLSRFFSCSRHVLRRVRPLGADRTLFARLLLPGRRLDRHADGVHAWLSLPLDGHDSADQVHAWFILCHHGPVARDGRVLQRLLLHPVGDARQSDRRHDGQYLSGGYVLQCRISHAHCVPGRFVCRQHGRHERVRVSAGRGRVLLQCHRPHDGGGQRCVHVGLLLHECDRAAVAAVRGRVAVPARVGRANRVLGVQLPG
jgi:hypothetical protein